MIFVLEVEDTAGSIRLCLGVVGAILVLGVVDTVCAILWPEVESSAGVILNLGVVDAVCIILCLGVVDMLCVILSFCITVF